MSFHFLFLYGFRYSILDLILRTIEALSVLDDHSQDICSNKEVFHLVSDLVRLPDKVEVYFRWPVTIKLKHMHLFISLCNNSLPFLEPWGWQLWETNGGYCTGCQFLYYCCSLNCKYSDWCSWSSFWDITR